MAVLILETPASPEEFAEKCRMGRCPAGELCSCPLRGGPACSGVTPDDWAEMLLPGPKFQRGDSVEWINGEGARRAGTVEGAVKPAVEWSYRIGMAFGRAGIAGESALCRQSAAAKPAAKRPAGRKPTGSSRSRRRA